jgi:hypothetical protein
MGNKLETVLWSIWRFSHEGGTSLTSNCKLGIYFAHLHLFRLSKHFLNCFMAEGTNYGRPKLDVCGYQYNVSLVRHVHAILLVLGAPELGHVIGLLALRQQVTQF